MHESNEKLPLSLAQKDIYFDQLHRSGIPLYNIGGYIRLGQIDSNKLREAHRRLIVSHCTFGTRIFADGKDFWQRVV